MEILVGSAAIATIIGIPLTIYFHRKNRKENDSAKFRNEITVCLYSILRKRKSLIYDDFVAIYNSKMSNYDRKHLISFSELEILDDLHSYALVSIEEPKDKENMLTSIKEIRNRFKI